MGRSVPHRCPACLEPNACGFHGILVFEDARAPLCRHNEKPGKACHTEPVRMVPSSMRLEMVDGVRVYS